jgi:phospholipid/cholesterol/gamma-HCH transport system permease protein
LPAQQKKELQTPVSDVLRVSREGNRSRLSIAGRIDLPNLAAVTRDIAEVAPTLEANAAVDVHLEGVVHIDGSGAVLLARLLDDLEGSGHRVAVDAERNPEAARLVALYRACHGAPPDSHAHRSALERLGRGAALLSKSLMDGVEFLGGCTRAVSKAIVAPRSVDWRGIPGLIQQVGADGLPVIAAANLLIGLIIAFLGISQLRRFGATVYVPELVVVAQFRELGPLVTGIVVAGRSGAGLASEIGSMVVSEEIDALRVIGMDPLRWLVAPRCVALLIALPVLTWIGNLVALVGGLLGTLVMADMSARAYLTATADSITAVDFFSGMIKTPFLGLAIGLIACGQGLATRGGAAAVGARTTTAVVLSIFGVIAISAFFTFSLALLGR